MKQLILGVILGSALTGGIVGAGQFYDSSGRPNAPAGSIQSFDYYRQRQQFIDIGKMRKAQEEQLRTNPCGR